MDNLTTIKQVKEEVTKSEFYPLLAEGWVLLHVYSQLTCDNRVDIFYVMGHEELVKEPTEETPSRYQKVVTNMLEKSKV